MSRRTGSSAFADDDRRIWSGNSLGMTAHDALASPENLQIQTITSSTKRLPQGAGTTNEIADLRHAGHRISAARLQPLPRRGRRRQPRRRFWRAGGHRAFARIDRAGVEMDRRSRRRQALWTRRVDPREYLDFGRKERHLEEPGGADFARASRFHPQPPEKIR